MPETEHRQVRGIEKLQVPEQAQYQSLKTELIQAAAVYRTSGQIHVDRNMRLSMPVERVMRLKQLVGFMGITKDECEEDLRGALLTLDLVSLFFPLQQSEVVPEAVSSNRPNIDEDTRYTVMAMVDRERAQLNGLIQTVEHISQNNLVVENLAKLCDEVVEGCKKYGGVKKYLGDNELSTFILEHAATVGLGGKNVDVKKPTPQHPVIPPSSVKRGEASSTAPEEEEVFNYTDTWLQRVARSVGKFLKGK